MEKFIFVGADGKRSPIYASIKDNIITIEDGSPFADYLRGKFERTLPDGTVQILYVTTFNMTGSADGFGCGYEIAVSE